MFGGKLTKPDSKQLFYIPQVFNPVVAVIYGTFEAQLLNLVFLFCKYSIERDRLRLLILYMSSRWHSSLQHVHVCSGVDIGWLVIGKIYMIK